MRIALLRLTPLRSARTLAPHASRVFASVAALWMLVPSPALAKDKTDVVILENGDRVTGEIKVLERGLLLYGTDSIGSLSAEWEEVRGLESRYYFEIGLRDGERFFGSFLPGVGLDTLGVGIDHIVRRVPVHDVVSIVPLEKRFWSRFDGSLSIGLSYTKATRISQYTFDSYTEYKTQTYRTNLDISTTKSETEGQEPKTKSGASLGLTRILSGRWFVGLTGGYERNDELGIYSRFLAGAGSGYYFLQTTHSELSGLAGLTVNTEQPTNSDSSVRNVEAVLTGSFSVFRYSSPKTEISISSSGYANVNQGNRYRLEFDVTGKYEIFSDFIFQLSFYEQVDSNPPSAAAAANDYSVTTSVGWSY